MDSIFNSSQIFLESIKNITWYKMFEFGITNITTIVLSLLSIFLFYRLQKHMEDKSNTCGFARILQVEIKRFSALDNLHYHFDPNPDSFQIPQTRIYDGLLNTDNIQCFDDELQDDLDKLYRIFKLFPSNLNMSHLRKTYDKLDAIQYNKRPYRKKFNPFSK